MNNSKLHSGDGLVIAAIIVFVAALLGAVVFVTYVLNTGINDTLNIFTDNAPAAAQIAANMIG